LFIGSDRGLFYLNTRSKQFKLLQGNYLLVTGSRLPNIDKLVFDKQQRLWMLCEKQGVCVMNTNDLSAIGFLADSTNVYYDCDVWNNSIVTGTSKGLQQYYLEDGKLRSGKRRFSRIDCSQHTDVFAVKTDKENNIWFSNKNNLVKINGLSGRYEYVNESKVTGKTWTSFVFGIYFDRAANIWLGCLEGLGFSSNKPAEFLTYYKSVNSEDIIHHAYYLYPYTDSILLACAEDGLYRVNQQTGAIRTLDRDKSFFYVFEDFNKNLIVSNDEGLFVLRQDKLIPLSIIYPEFKQAGLLIINNHVQVGDSMYVLASQNRKGIFTWNFRKKEIVNITKNDNKLNLKDNNVNVVYKDRSGVVWVLCDNSVSLYQPEKDSIQLLSIVDPQTNKTYAIYFDMCEIRGLYYIATYVDGIVVLDKNYKFIRNISTQHNLANNAVYKLLPYKDSLLFATTNNGLSVINVAKDTIRNYYDANGLHSSVFEELSGNVRNDYVYAGGKDGFSIIRPALFTVNKISPQVFISRVKIETSGEAIDTSNLLVESISIPNNVIQATVYFSGLNYSSPGLTTFSYRLRELSDNWTNIGAQNFTSLIGLNPGTYHLQVKAANEDGVWSSPIELTLIFLPKWYQTWWFKSIIALLIIGLLYGLYRYRLSQIKKEQQIRQRIASDLHDDIGSTLNSIKVFANLSLMKPENNTAYLMQLKEGVQSAIVGVRDMVWVLDDKQDTFSHLVQRVEQFISPLASAQGIDFEKSLEASLSDSMLQKEEKRNLYLIIKEAFNNSVKYSGATSLQLQIKKALYDKYVIVIRDNGKGFDVSTIKNGNGLNNLRYRATQIKYSIDISSSPGNGTVITLHKF
jgi:two-component sensor histidine kinase